MTEVWKPIIGYEEFYEVSNFGNVRSLERVVCEKSKWGGQRKVKHKSRYLKPGKTARGYLLVVLCNEHGQKSHMVHRLVATAFCEEKNGCMVVNHIDNNQTNNHADNLEWVTQKDNVHHAIAIGAKKVRGCARG